MEPWLTTGPTFTKAVTTQFMAEVEMHLHCASLWYWHLFDATELESLTGSSRILDVAALWVHP